VIHIGAHGERGADILELAVRQHNDQPTLALRVVDADRERAACEGDPFAITIHAR
jgi:hypothetical protein